MATIAVPGDSCRQCGRGFTVVVFVVVAVVVVIVVVVQVVNAVVTYRQSIHSGCTRRSAGGGARSWN